MANITTNTPVDAKVATLVAGKVSGIQRFLFATNEAGGGQAKRLRARSFIISLVAELAALRVLRALGWPLDAHYLLHCAGKFLLAGETEHDLQGVLTNEGQLIREWLAQHTNGELQFAIASGSSGTNPIEAYRQAQQQLHAARWKPWVPDTNKPWDPSRLVLPPIDRPCDLCGRLSATEGERDTDTGELRCVCRWCGLTRRLGQQLPCGRWLVIRDEAVESDFDLLGFGISLKDDLTAIDNGVIAVANLVNPRQRPPQCPADRFLERRLMAHVPVNHDGRPLEFIEIADSARGDKLLGVLMADVDSLGVAIETSMKRQDGLSGLTNLSHSLDEFFSEVLKAEIEKRGGNWDRLYTIFSGGDDLVMAGPWDLIFEFAGRLHGWFRDRFGAQGLTLSAGLALIKPKRPIRAAVAEAEHLLEIAKTRVTREETGPKDQCSAFGQVWKWKHHQMILDTALRLVEWVDAGQIERGWLHTLLSLVEARHPDVLLGKLATRSPDSLATARLAHHVTRNYRRGSDARRWAEDLILQFDETTSANVRYLPSVLRHALTVTRTTSEKE